MNTFTTTSSSTFTIAHAKRIASKVATDLHRFHRYYGKPSAALIAEFEDELIELMKVDVVDEVTYGLQEDGKWITAVKYKSVNGTLISDSMPGRLRAGFNVNGASFFSYLVYNSKWSGLSQAERDRIEARLPFQREGAAEPSVKSGYCWSRDLDYSAGGRALLRSSIQSY